MTAKEHQHELERQRREIEGALNEQLVATIRASGPLNAFAWLAVTIGGFLINLLVLVVVTGG